MILSEKLEFKFYDAIKNMRPYHHILRNNVLIEKDLADMTEEERSSQLRRMAARQSADDVRGAECQRAAMIFAGDQSLEDFEDEIEDLELLVKALRNNLDGMKKHREKLIKKGLKNN